MASNWAKMSAARYPIGVGYNGRRTRWSTMTDLRIVARAQAHASRQTKRSHGQQEHRNNTLCLDYDPRPAGYTQVVLAVTSWMVVHRNHLWLIPALILHRERLRLLATTVAPWSVPVSCRGRARQPVNTKIQRN